MPAPNDISLRQLQYAVAVAETGGFHKAAARCHVSQPTLSVQIKQLESVLGVTLFERDRRKVLLTGAGEEVAARARRVLLEVEDLFAATMRVSDPLAGTYRVGVLPTIAPYFLPAITPRLRAAFPKLRLVFREEKTPVILRALGAGELDAGMLAVEADLGDVAQAEIARDHFVVALPPGHPLTKRKRLRIEDLAGEAVLLLDEGHCMRAQALSLCARVGAHEAAFRATSLATLTQMVAAGDAVTLLPEMAIAVENRHAQIEMRPLVSPPHRTIALVWRPRSPFGDTFRTIAAKLRT